MARGPSPPCSASAITITGSGLQSRDEDLWPTVPDYRPFRQIAERLEHLDVDAAEASMVAAGIPRERAYTALRLAYSWRSGLA